MKTKFITKYENVDIKIFKIITAWLYQRRLVIYLTIFFLVLRAVILRFPYVNILYVQNQQGINYVIIGLLIYLLVSFKARVLIMLSVGLYVVSLVLLLIGKDLQAEIVGNVVYVLFLIGVLSMIYSLVRGQYGKAK